MALHAKEQKAYIELNVGNETDIRYGKGLPDDGIIGEEEFAIKKQELLNLLK